MGKLQNKHCLGYLCLVFIIAIGLTVISDKAATAASDVIKWKCQLYWPSASASYPHALSVVKKIKDRSKGRLIIETYPAKALVPTSEIYNSVKRGFIQMGSISPAYVRSQQPLANIASNLPFNFQSVAECLYFFNHLGFEKMLRDAFAKDGLYYVTEKLPPVELTLTKPVHTLEDFKGLKIRSVGILQNFFNSIGASASYLPASEVFPALASGVVDGAHYAAVQGAYSMKFYEITKYHLRVPLSIDASSWIVSQKALDALPNDLQQVVYSTLHDEMWRRSNEYQILEEQTAILAQKEYGVKMLTLPPEEYKKMLVYAMKLWDEVAQKSPECATAIQMLKDFNKSLGR